MATNPLFRANNSPTNTTKPTKAVNQTGTKVRLTHNTFDNSYFNFKTQRYGLYEPFWWKVCTAGDVEPFSNSHNVRSLPFASPIESPMKLNKDYFQVPLYSIQPNAWDYIFKNPTQGDDVPVESQNLFPLQNVNNDKTIFDVFIKALDVLNDLSSDSEVAAEVQKNALLVFFSFENFLSSGSLLYNLGYKINPVFYDSTGKAYNYDQLYDYYVRRLVFKLSFDFDDVDSPTGKRRVTFTTNATNFPECDFVVDNFTIMSLWRSHFGDMVSFDFIWTGTPRAYTYDFGNIATFDETLSDSGVGYIRMDVINAYQLACAQYYVNPRVDFIYNAQLYRDNFIQLVRLLVDVSSPDGEGVLNIQSFDYNGIPVLFDYLSMRYYSYLSETLCTSSVLNPYQYATLHSCAVIMYYLFGYREQLRFGDYIVDSRTQALGYGEPGSDNVQVYDDGVSVMDMSQKLVLQRFRGAVAHLDNSAEDYLATMFHEAMPPDYHYPKFIVHSEFGVKGDEISNTTSDDQGNIVTNLKSGDDTAEFNIDVSVNSILIGISYVSIPSVYCQIKERSYMHLDRYDMFQPMLQYLGDQGIYNREVSDFLPNPADSYGYTSRNGEYKQRMSQCSGAFVTTLRSWIFTVDLPEFGRENSFPRLSLTQSPLAIRTFDFEFNRFLKAQTGVSLGTGFHFIMKYNNKNVDNRPMDVNPLPLYPSNQL